MSATIYLYGRPGCHLCEEARRVVDAVAEARAAAGRGDAVLVERDIETDPAWERAFHLTIPVLEIDGERLEIATSPSRIRAFIESRLDGAPAAPPDQRLSC